jgi:hypothetical protein
VLHSVEPYQNTAALRNCLSPAKSPQSQLQLTPAAAAAHRPAGSSR